MLCIVVAVSAGDAMTLQCGDLKEGAQQMRTVNLRAVAAPEDDQPFALESRMHLESMCAGSPVTITLQGKGRDGDPVADVRCRHVDAATEQVRNGLAWHDEAYGKDLDHLRTAQSEAIVSGREIWATRSPVAPWDWKKHRTAIKKKALQPAKKVPAVTGGTTTSSPSI